ncbi:MAG TPA: HAD-IC family P-type ATPase, partial [Verrucomicrobiae bacterium]|nr:HAD-IC family P-type ATPase [Verrucomicrobiae bacterium]
MSVTSELCIGGMTCASCAAHVAAALREVPGVEDASVNLATERARVVHAAEVPVAALIGAVEGAGYEAGAPGAQDDAARRRDAELARQRRLLLLAVLLTIPEAVLAMAVADFAGKVWIEALLALPVWGVVGWEFHRGALAGLRSGNFSMDTLVSLGSTAAMLLSFYLAATGSAPYFESAAAIVTLVFAGRVLESGARAKSDRAVRELLALRPETARRRRNGTLEAIAIDDVHIGDELEVLAGERVPVDGTVVEGESTIDRSLLTGEPMPVDVRAGERVEQGTINGDGALLVRADAVGAGTALARIVEAVQRAQGSAPPIARLADRAAGVFVPVVLVLAALTAIGWLFTGHSWVTALVSAVAVLVVACPCALG